MSKIKVIIHRTYEFCEEFIKDKLLEDSTDKKKIEFSEEEIKTKAAEIAMDFLSDEMVYFVDELNDFVIYKVELIPNK